MLPCFLCGRNARYNTARCSSNLSLAAMALTWDNEPAGSGLPYNCLQKSPCLCQSPNSFPSRSTDHIAPAENLSLIGFKANPDWSAPLWLSSLRQIIGFRFSLSKAPQEPYSCHRNAAASTVPANTTKYQQTMPPNQTQKTAVVTSSSTPTGSM